MSQTEQNSLRLSSAAAAVAKACQKAGIENLTWHDLRRTFATWLRESGVDPFVIQQSLGHKTIALTLRYAHLSSDKLKAGIKVLDNCSKVVAKTVAEQG